MDAAQTPSAQIRSIVATALSESGMGQRRLEATRSLPAWSLRGIMDPSREQAPSVDRAADILTALGYELRICRREAVSAAASKPSRSTLRPPHVDPDAPAPLSGTALETVSDRRLAEILAAVADEWEALNEAGRVSLETRIWTLHPDLRERERRLARVVGWLGWRVVEDDARPAAASKKIR